MGWSHTHLWWVKIREGYLQNEKSQPHTRTLAQNSSARKISPHNFWLQKPVGIDQWKKLLEPQAVPLKKPTYRLTYSDSFPLSSSTGVAA